MKIDDLLIQLEKVRQTGRGRWMACCPAHDDRSPSLGVKLTDDGKILLHCFAGCEVADIAASIGFTLADLMPESPDGYDRKAVSIPKFSKSEMFDRILFESLILSIAVREFLNGKELENEDLKRISQAEALINHVAKECGR